MDDCSAEYAKIKIVLLRWARVSVPILAGYVGQCGGQGAHLDKIWQMRPQLCTFQSNSILIYSYWFCEKNQIVLL